MRHIALLFLAASLSATAADKPRVPKQYTI